MNHLPQCHPKCSTLYASRICRDTDIRQAMASSIAYLTNMTVVVTAKPLTRAAITFSLTVHDTKSSSTWRHLRSYSECLEFQNRILNLLSRGHLCFAECPWLYAYLQRSLPVETKSHIIFGVVSRGLRSRAIEKQRQALERLFLTLQRVLLNPLNHKCTILMQQVAPAVIQFITNCNDMNEHEPLISPSCELPLARTFSVALAVDVNEFKETEEKFKESSTGTAASCDNQEEALPDAENNTSACVNNAMARQRVCCAMCALHKVRSDEQVFACWRVETTSSPFSRLVVGFKAKASMTISKHEKTKEKDAWVSPAFSQRITSPMEPSEVPGVCVLNHDGTPKELFPRSPRGLIESPPRASSVCEMNLHMLDGYVALAHEKQSHGYSSKKAAVLGSRKSSWDATSLRTKISLGIGII
ncbi:hypothetical protein PsorP6_010709 [Peronosclerospora sorghi]|uniref:Uncharacterized protein n=1 Tax=Peronosclerospora sorghi TaxID=230839 RepID=A0ACC0VTV7_9STRA|nr:hypothetical protein PsorP6_010709 [Peronosclerospora sorghi]